MRRGQELLDPSVGIKLISALGHDALALSAGVLLTYTANIPQLLLVF